MDLAYIEAEQYAFEKCWSFFIVTLKNLILMGFYTTKTLAYNSLKKNINWPYWS